MSTKDWIAAEAERRGIPLEAHEVEAIAVRLEQHREALGRLRAKAAALPEPPYRFVVGEEAEPAQ